MNSKRSLMTALVGVALLAMPLTAAAKDHGRFHGQAFVNQHEFRNGRSATWTAAPAVVVGHDWREHHHGWNNGYQNYSRGYYPAPVYAAPVYAAPVYSGYGAGYGGGYGGGRGCAQAQRAMRIYAHDRATGHPAAAADVLRQNQGAMRSGCVSGAPLGGGFLGGLGGLGGQGGYRGVPAYTNYGGYNGGYNGYNGGYGQPNGNGSMLAPLLQYIR